MYQNPPLTWSGSWMSFFYRMNFHPKNH
jgi:hypothetical protein